MRLPSFRHIFKADYKQEFQDLVDKLSVSLNNGIEAIYDALNGKLSLSDNLYCDVTDVKVTVDSDGIPKIKTGYKIKLTTKPIGIQVIDAINQTNSNTYPTSGIFIDFTYENNQITINAVKGLQADQVYNLKIITWG